MSNNHLRSLNFEEAIPAEVTVDSSGATLREVALDMDALTLTLSFSEVMRANTLNVKLISVSTNTSLDGMNLTNTSILSDWVTARDPDYSVQADASQQETNGPLIAIAIGKEDADELKRRSDLATNKLDTLVRVGTGAVLDMAGVSCIAAELQARAFTPDTSQPELLDAQLNLSSGIMTLSFSETVNASTFDPNPIIVSNNLPQLHANNEHVRLTTSATQQIDSTILLVNLSFEDLNQIKRHRSLARATAAVAIYYTLPFVRDMNANEIKLRQDVHRLQMSSVSPDQVRPTIVRFDFDRDSGRLTVEYDEIVKLTSVNAASFVLSDSISSQLRLQKATIVGQHEDDDVLSLLTDERDSHIISIQLHSDELDIIKASASICTTARQCLLSASSTAATDIAGNNQSITSALEASSIAGDVTRPRLLGFSMNLVTSRLTLSFDEPMNTTFFHPTGITILNSPSNASSSFSLTTGRLLVTSPPFRILIIEMSQMDLQAIQSDRDLCSDRNNTYVSVSSFVAKDNSQQGNLLVAIEPSTAMQADAVANYAPAHVAFLAPTSGSVFGGFIGTVVGQGFTQNNLTALSPYLDDLSVEILIGNMPASNVTVLNDTVLTFLFPSGPVGSADLQLIIDGGIDTHILAAFEYLSPPRLENFRPATITKAGGTLIELHGLNFGPASSATSPPVSVYIGNRECLNVTVLNASRITCISPILVGGSLYNVSVDIAGSVAAANRALTALDTPTISSINPSQGHDGENQTLAISGKDFGASTLSGLAPNVLVFIGSQSCRHVLVINDTYALCSFIVQAGSHAVTIIVDGQANQETFNFVGFKDAGQFDLAVPSHYVSELNGTFTFSVIRTGSPNSSPATLQLAIEEGTATSPDYFVAAAHQLSFPNGVDRVSVSVNVTAGHRFSRLPRNGAADDRTFVVSILDVQSEEGEATIGLSQVIVTIEAICEIISFECSVSWSQQGISYMRVV
eukprot:TRINITY_DN7030_c0_g1_i1.p1 TRINITY_DN7030_c0_g1~~TRINITY_DN7030_c0_g1_i1.p1  ORF type:complete len:1023 (+),score=131.75 TRINITY_DN7030_c0_g1_i1:154-3069(+)